MLLYIFIIQPVEVPDKSKLYVVLPLPFAAPVDIKSNLFASKVKFKLVKVEPVVVMYAGPLAFSQYIYVTSLLENVIEVDELFNEIPATVAFKVVCVSTDVKYLILLLEIVVKLLPVKPEPRYKPYNRLSPVALLIAFI